MSNILHLQHCPSCKSARINPVLKVRDYTVSQEEFGVWECGDCSLRFTQDIPSQDEIGRYYQSAAYVSHSDTKKGLINKLYHFVRNYTLRSKRNLIERTSRIKAGKLLDVGAGTGMFAKAMQDAGWKVTGLEPDETARLNALNQGLQLHPADKLFSLDPGCYDVITMWHVLEHVHDLHGYLNSFQKILKKGGTLFIAVPDYTSYDAAHYKQYWAAYDVPRHLYHFSPESMNRLMLQHGFVVKDYKPMWFDSFYVSMLSEQYKSGKNNLLKAIMNGMRSNIAALKDAKKCSSIIYVIKSDDSKARLYVHE